jgi:hypothetical protein
MRTYPAKQNHFFLVGRLIRDIGFKASKWEWTKDGVQLTNNDPLLFLSYSRGFASFSKPCRKPIVKLAVIIENCGKNGVEYR